MAEEMGSVHASAPSQRLEAKATASDTLAAHPALRATVSQLGDSTNLFVHSLNGIKQDQALVRPGPRSNPMLWVAGHLVQARTRLLRAFGPPRQVPWENLFATGATVSELTPYPSIGEIEAVWRSASEELTRRIQAAPRARYDDATPDWLLSRDGTLGGALTYAAYHEAYHIGQLGYIRKWLGYEAVFEPDARSDR